MNLALADLIRRKSVTSWKKVEQNRHISSCDTAEELEIDHKTIFTYLKKGGFTKKLDTRIPHDLTKINLTNRVLICNSLLKCDETESFLKRFITCDEKWIAYDTKMRKRSRPKRKQAPQTTAEPRRKEMNRTRAIRPAEKPISRGGSLRGASGTAGARRKNSPAATGPRDEIITLVPTSHCDRGPAEVLAGRPRRRRP